jgi:hypothetical protein
VFREYDRIHFQRHLREASTDQWHVGGSFFMTPEQFADLVAGITAGGNSA